MVKLDSSVRCQLCGGSTRQIAVHVKCLEPAIALFGFEDPDANWVARKYRESFRAAFLLAVDACYLCGELLGDEVGQADHVDPKSAGGTSRWSNIGITHGRCNQSKQARLGITVVQNDRLAVQHEKLLDAAATVDVGVWLQWIGRAVEDLQLMAVVDVPTVMRVHFEEWFAGDWFAPPPWAFDAFYSLADDPAFPRDAISLQRAGSVIDAWKGGEYRLRRRGPRRRDRRIDPPKQTGRRSVGDGARRLSAPSSLGRRSWFQRLFGR